MSDATKVEAKAKLDAIRDKIGYPDKWRDYSALVVKRDDPLGNAERNAGFERQRNYDKLGKPVDEKEWGMTPPTVNAYYNPPNNDINFPAGHSAAAVLRQQHRSGGELWRHRRGDWARDDARVRRPGIEVRSQGQREAVVHGGGPGEVQRADRLRGEGV